MRLRTSTDKVRRRLKSASAYGPRRLEDGDRDCVDVELRYIFGVHTFRMVQSSALLSESVQQNDLNRATCTHTIRTSIFNIWNEILLLYCTTDCLYMHDTMLDLAPRMRSNTTVVVVA